MVRFLEGFLFMMESDGHIERRSANGRKDNPSRTMSQIPGVFSPFGTNNATNTPSRS